MLVYVGAFDGFFNCSFIDFIGYINSHKICASEKLVLFVIVRVIEKILPNLLNNS